jgi:DNA (cytosine-5)-methyltransferase 1
LFSGIGGIDLGLERAGFEVVWFCERDEYCQTVLAKHWPGLPIYDDATKLPDDLPPVDVITAGFPCQPVSYAGRRKAQDDDRWLWPYVENIICTLRPRGVLLENVPGLFTAGFDDVIGGLAACGYDAEWDCIPAAAVGAPHRRDRVFIIATPCDVATDSAHGGWDDPMAYASGTGPHRAIREVVEGQAGRSRNPNLAGPCGRGGGALVANADCVRMERPRAEQPTTRAFGVGEVVADAASERHAGSGQCGKRGDAPQAGTREAGVPIASGEREKWPPEPGVGRVADGIPARVDRLRALGNAVVPQVAEYVGHQLARMMGVRNA